MPADKDKVKELSIRVPHELWDDILALFHKRHQSGIPFNQMIVTLLYEAMDKYQTESPENRESQKKIG